MNNTKSNFGVFPNPFYLQWIKTCNLIFLHFFLKHSRYINESDRIYLFYKNISIPLAVGYILKILLTQYGLDIIIFQ